MASMASMALVALVARGRGRRGKRPPVPQPASLRAAPARHLHEGPVLHGALPPAGGDRAGAGGPSQARAARLGPSSEVVGQGPKPLRRARRRVRDEDVGADRRRAHEDDHHAPGAETLAGGPPVLRVCAGADLLRSERLGDTCYIRTPLVGPLRRRLAGAGRRSGPGGERRPQGQRPALHVQHHGRGPEEGDTEHNGLVAEHDVARAAVHNRDVAVRVSIVADVGVRWYADNRVVPGVEPQYTKSPQSLEADRDRGELVLDAGGSARATRAPSLGPLAAIGHRAEEPRVDHRAHAKSRAARVKERRRPVGRVLVEIQVPA
mmetsp:Transcript_62764/g.202446  ORF Transcript_62764/g.202446 Transcript_62764/m.202446 type:complete len:320 (+) Transcript_62764:26-985(+)